MNYDERLDLGFPLSRELLLLSTSLCCLGFLNYAKHVESNMHLHYPQSHNSICMYLLLKVYYIY